MSVSWEGGAVARLGAARQEGGEGRGVLEVIEHLRTIHRPRHSNRLAHGRARRAQAAGRGVRRPRLFFTPGARGTACGRGALSPPPPPPRWLGSAPRCRSPARAWGGGEDRLRARARSAEGREAIGCGARWGAKRAAGSPRRWPRASPRRSTRRGRTPSRSACGAGRRWLSAQAVNATWTNGSGGL